MSDPILAGRRGATDDSTNRSRLWSSTKLVRRSAVVLIVAALGLANATAASAHGPDEERSPDTSAGEAQVLAAIQRDLGLNEEQATAMLAGSAEAAELDGQLRDELGDAYAGSWLHQTTGVLMVAVTDPQAARTVRASGARAKLVSRGERQLDTIMTDVGAVAEAGSGGIREWYVDPEAKQVVVSVQEGQEDVAAELLAAHGDAIRVEPASDLAQPDNHGGPADFLDGGIPYASCSTGFNMRNPTNGNRFLLTAGHCHQLAGTVPVGGTVTSHGTTIGPVTAAFYGPQDDGLVQVTNTTSWGQGPWVWTYDHFAFGSFISVSGWSDPPVGTSVCKSGATTLLTCGTIQAKNVSFTNTNPDGSRTSMTRQVRHTACQRGGDSGGPIFVPTFSDGSWTATAVGINTSSVRTASNQCLSTEGRTNIAYYYPLAITLPFYEFTFGVELWS